MKIKVRKPSHPGAILFDLYMGPLGLSVTELANRLGVSRKTVSKIVNQRGAVTPDMALRFSKAFKTTPEMWLNLQIKFDLFVAKESRDWKGVRPFELHALAA